MRGKTKHRRENINTLARSAGSLLELFPSPSRRKDVGDVLRCRTQELSELGTKIVEDMLSDDAIRDLAEAWGAGLDRETIRELAHEIDGSGTKVNLMKSKNDD